MTAQPAAPATDRETSWSAYFDSAWLKRHREEIIEPDLPIVDPHHHLWPWTDYMVPELLADLRSGHNIVATVHLETALASRPDGPDHLRPVGETEALLALLDDPLLARSGAPAICAGIVGMVDLEADPDLVDEALAAHVAAGRGRFRGIRLNAYYDRDFGWSQDARPHRLGEPAVRRGFARLAHHDLVCDVMVFHPQLAETAEFAEAFPDTAIVVDHLGGVLGRGAYRRREDEVFALWRDGVAALARQPNVVLKLGGLTNGFFSGWRQNEADEPPTSAAIAEAYRPYVHEAIALLGANRCMFESNFPADKSHVDYAVLWNAFKRLTLDCATHEREQLFSGTARRVYALEVPALAAAGKRP